MPRSTFLSIPILVFFLLAGCVSASPGPAAVPLETTAPAVVTSGPKSPLEVTPQATNPPETAVEPTATTPPTATVGPPTATTAPSETPTTAPSVQTSWIAYTGKDGNIWLVDRLSGERQQVTTDAAPFKPNQQQERTVSYCCSKWSSDGRYLAYRQELGQPVPSGFQYSFSLLAYDLTTGETRTVLENQQISGFDWKPDSYQIAFSLMIPTEYFMDRGQNAEFATPVMAMEVDIGDSYELVPPSRGYALVSPKWSPDGRFLSFQEVLYMEGSGQFAYYDFETQQYIAWQDIIGGYSWSPDGEYVAYDRLSYAPSGEERVWVSNRMGEEERQISPDYENRYAFNPLFSPSGERLAFMTGGPEQEGPSQYEIFVLPFPQGEPKGLGEFVQPISLSWSPDGAYLLFSAGSWDEQQVIELDVSNGATAILAQGSEPTWQPME